MWSKWLPWAVPACLVLGGLVAGAPAGASAQYPPRGVVPAGPGAVPYRLGVVILVNRNGALVQRVFPAEAGDQMGLVPGDTIVRVNGRAVTSMAGYQRLLATCGGGARVPGWEPGLGGVGKRPGRWGGAPPGGTGG